jgi:transketolase
MNTLEKEINTLEQQILILEIKIQEKSAAYKKQYNEEVQDYEIRQEQEFQTRFKSELEMRTDAVRNQYVMEKFYEANAAMQAAIEKSYPEPVLIELAQFTANCLSENLTQVPTAAEGYRKITDLFLFTDWPSDQ